VARNFDGVSDAAWTGLWDLSANADFSISAWVHRNGGSSGGILFEFSEKNGFDVIPVAGGVNDLMRSYGAGLQWADTYPSPTSNVWHHHVWIIPCNGVAPPQNNQAWIDGVNQTLTTVGHSGVANCDTSIMTHAARRLAGVNSNFLNCRIAEFTVWSGMPWLTQRKIQSLAAGASPFNVQPERIIQYIPYLGDASPECDAHGGNLRFMTLSGTTQIAHPWIRTLQSFDR